MSAARSAEERDDLSGLETFRKPSRGRSLDNSSFFIPQLPKAFF
jgi:hypothetical protein